MTSKDENQEQKLEEFKLKLRERLVTLMHHPNAANETKEVLKSCVEKLID